jgi:hypothetical protein
MARRLPAKQLEVGSIPIGVFQKNTTELANLFALSMVKSDNQDNRGLARQYS